MKLLLALTMGFFLVAPQAYAEDRTIEETSKTKTRDRDEWAPGADQPTTVTSEHESTTSTTRVEDEDKRLSKGGVFFEPMLMATQADSSIKTSQLPAVTGNADGDSRGYGIGLRLGGHVSEILLLGVDARYLKMELENSIYNKTESDVYNIAPVIGLQTPYFGIRLLAGYVVAGENNPNSGNQGVDLKFKDARGLRYGAGIYVGAVSINLEYEDLTYNNTEIESFGTLASNRETSVDATSKGYTLSLSFPVEM